MATAPASPERWDVVVVGAGPSGLLCAARAAERGRRTLLLEKGAKPGVKILMSGGSRCNLTHDTDRRGIVEAFGPSGRFLHSALAALDPRQLVALFESEGMPTKVEPGGKVFPRSDRAADVQAALLRRLSRAGCTLALEEPLQDVSAGPGGFQLTTSRRSLAADKLVLATGGKSYPGCGTTGDGYRWAAALGHTVAEPRPALVPVKTDAPWAVALQGITVPDVLVRVIESGGPFGALGELARCRGSVLFAHFGLSGPAVLNVSRAVSSHPSPRALNIVCDLAPAASRDQFAAMVSRACTQAGKRRLATILDQWFARRLAVALMELAGIAPDTRAADLSRHLRQRLVDVVKQLRIPLAGTLGFEKAEVTAGGVCLAEVDSRSMESKRVAGLYFAGELLDLDGPIGGYNFQAAFSTGWLAGESV